MEPDFSEMTLDQLLEYATKCTGMLPPGFHRRFDQIKRSRTERYSDIRFETTNYLSKGKVYTHPAQP